MLEEALGASSPWCPRQGAPPALRRFPLPCSVLSRGRGQVPAGQEADASSQPRRTKSPVLALPKENMAIPRPFPQSQVSSAPSRCHPKPTALPQASPQYLDTHSSPGCYNASEGQCRASAFCFSRQCQEGAVPTMGLDAH